VQPSPRREYLLIFSRDLASMISSAPYIQRLCAGITDADYNQFPSFVTIASLAQPLRGTFLMYFPLFRSIT